jgi:type 1 glutamine amidotransferase
VSCKRFIVAVLLFCFAAFASAAEPKKVLLLSQKRDHPPASHEYHSGVHVLAKCLQGVPGLQVTAANADEPCPDVPKLIDAADAVVLYLGEGGRWMQVDKQRLAAIDRLAARGGGIVGLHWGIGAKDDKYVPHHLELMGGMHGGSDRKYVVKELDVRTVHRDHPINAGVDLKRLDDEYYYRLKFAKQGKVTPLLQTTIDGNAETIAWAFQRPDGGRSFGFGGMHYHKNWQIPGCRRLVAQGILWTLKLPVPKAGLAVEVTEEDLKIRDSL